MNSKMSPQKACIPQKRSGSLHLTQKVDYAILLLVTLSEKKNAITSLKTITKEKNVSFLFMQKIARILEKANLIKAERGKFGGYKLTKPENQIKLREIIEALEGPITMAPCMKKTSSNKILCKSEKACFIRQKLLKINNEIQEYFTSISLDYFK